MLGSLERGIIAVMQELREGTTRDVLEGLRQRGKNVAYTTVSTILMRLHGKGLLNRRTESFKGGDRYVYLYKDIEGAYIDSLLDGLVTAFGQEGVVHLAQRLDGISEDEVRRIRERLKL